MKRQGFEFKTMFKIENGFDYCVTENGTWNNNNGI